MSKVLEKFRKLPPGYQAAIAAITAWNIWLSAAAQRDIQRRPPAEIRGPKLIWRVVCLTNTVGPAAYFRWGRRRAALR
jgi:hypothetical protein